MTLIARFSLQDESLVQDYLGRLQEVRITLSILQRTGIGKTVNNLRRVTNNEQLTTSAKSLLKNWKKLVPGSSPFASKSRTKTNFLFFFVENSTPRDEPRPTTTTMNSTASSQSSEEANSNEEKSASSKKLAEQKYKSFSSSSHSLDDVR